MNVFLMAGDDCVLDLCELLLLLLVLLILLGEFLHEVRDDDGRRSGTPNEAMDKDLAISVVVDGFIDESEGLVERSLDILANGVTEVDLFRLDTIAGENGLGEIALVGDVEDVEDAAGEEFGSIHRVHGRPEVDSRMNEGGIEVVVVASRR